MAASGSLRQLHTDLLAYSQGQLLRVDELWHELEGHLEVLAGLLTRKNKNEKSRTTIAQGSKVHQTNYIRPG